MVFPVVKYGCESWTIKKAEHGRIDAFELSVVEDYWESFRLQRDRTSPSWRKSVLKIHWKDWCWSWNSNTLDSWCKEVTYWKRRWCWERLKVGERVTEDKMVGWHHWHNGHEFEKALGVGDGQAGWQAAVHGVTKSWTWLSAWTELNWTRSTVYQYSRSVESNCLWPHRLQYTRLPCPSPTPGAYSNACPSSWWCQPTIYFSVIPVSSGLQSFPASGSFQMSQFFTSGGQRTGVSASPSVLPMNIQD